LALFHTVHQLSRESNCKHLTVQITNLSVSAYACAIVGLKYSRDWPCGPARIDVGDVVHLHHEPGNPANPGAVAAYHGIHKIGYLPLEKRWIWKLLHRCGPPQAVVVGAISNFHGDLVGLDVEFSVPPDGRQVPAPGTAPWAPHICALPKRPSFLRPTTGVSIVIAAFVAMAMVNACG
jgi:hypothetical protein